MGATAVTIRSRVRAALLGGLLVFSTGSALAASGADDPTTRARLDEIREHLVQARFESALSAIEALLGDPGLGLPERAEALVLRAQAHVAFGDLDSAERDYREILKLQPGYEPLASLTPQKAIQRFAKVRAEMVGRLKLTLDPRTADVRVDGLAVVPDASGVVYALAGERRLAVEQAGYDPDDRVVRVEADKDTEISVRLTPNARTIVLRTEPEDVTVRIDGAEVGRTRRPEGGGSGAPAELTVENLPLGEHLFELSRTCFTTQTLRDVLSVDLLEHAPKRYETVRLLPSRAKLVVRGGPAGAELRIDGNATTKLPATPLDVCPGDHALEIRAGGRTVWRESRELRGSEETVVEIVPRPNLVLVGDPAALERASAFAAGYTVLDRRAVPTGFDATSPQGWAALGLPLECDVALAVVPGSRPGEPDTWYLHSPILRRVARLVGPPAPEPRPSWTVSTWGFTTADTRADGPAIVVEVRSGSSAASTGLLPGSRIVSLGDRPVSNTQQVRATLAAASVARPIALAWVDPAGESRSADLIGRSGPRLLVDGSDPAAAVRRAAWANVDSIVDPEQASSALANLGLLFLDAGLPDLAEQAWRRVSWGERAGVGEGTKAYYLGVALEAQGKEDAAAALYRAAAATDARTFDDAGPEVAAAARDRLADLGISLSAR